jgi:histidinol dehydrogenase
MKLIRTFGKSAAEATAMIEEIAARGATSTASVAPAVKKIVADVKRMGDKTLRAYAEQFDGLQPGQDILVDPAEMEAAWSALPKHLKVAMKAAAANIQSFAEAQMPVEWITEPASGVRTGQIVRPLDAVGCYVPGGRYPLPSTVLMTTLPAQVAGVERIVVCSPKPGRETLAAAHLCGVTEFYRVGGAQAIAMLAYGTESTLPVTRIVGPGNLYVTAAKQLVSQDCGIDMPAGPTEIFVTSEMGNAVGIATDLVAQAEHDPETLAIFITTNEPLAKDVLKQVKLLAKKNKLARQSLEARGAIFVCETQREAQALTNLLAPEHLTVDRPEDLEWVRSAGSVFIGPHSAQSMGDYVSGPNHVLPTGRTGRLRGGLSVMDFLKLITVQQYTAKGLAKLGPHAIAMAEAEGLVGHAESVRARLKP